jgi:hypothetical protein
MRRRYFGMSGATPGVLAPGEQIVAGSDIYSADNRLQLAMQKDGNLVLYSGDGRALWSTGTTTGYIVSMQADGNLVVYNYAGTAVWSSGTGGNPGARLNLQPDGNMVIYSGTSALWSTGTYLPAWSPAHVFPGTTTTPPSGERRGGTLPPSPPQPPPPPELTLSRPGVPMWVWIAGGSAVALVSTILIFKKRRA